MSRYFNSPETSKIHVDLVMYIPSGEIVTPTVSSPESGIPSGSVATALSSVLKFHPGLATALI